jgi:hypothetical protein
MKITAKRRLGRTATLVWGAALVLALSAGTCDATAPAYVPPDEELPDRSGGEPDDVGFLLLPDGRSLLV